MRISLQVKLALISLLLLAIPFTGFRLSGILKDNLLESRRETLMFSATGRSLGPGRSAGTF